MSPRRFLALAASWGLLTLASPHANATSYALTVTLEDVTFAGGGTATGSFTLNVYGYATDLFSVTTTADGSFAAFTYDGANTNDSITNQPPNADSDVAFQALGVGPLGLQLDFSGVLGASNTAPIVTGGASCEFDSFQGCGGSPSLDIVSGYALVPEPMSFGLLAGGLLGPGAVRNRGRASATPSPSCTKA